MDSELAAPIARKAIRDALEHRSVATPVFSERLGYYTFRNSHEFHFIFIPDLSFRPPGASFTPGVAVCHKELALQLRKLEGQSYFRGGRPRARWEPRNFLHLYALREQASLTFFELAPLIDAVLAEFEYFLGRIDEFNEVSGPASLHRHLAAVTDMRAPTGITIEMFLDSLTMNQADFVAKYGGRELAPMHVSLRGAILVQDWCA